MHLLSSTLTAYRRGAQSLSAKSTGVLALGTCCIATLTDAEAQITVTTGPVTAAPGYAWFKASPTGLISNSDSTGALAYLFVNDLGSAYFHATGGGSYAFASADGIAIRFTAGQQVQGTFDDTGFLASGDPSIWSSSASYVGFKSEGIGGTHYGWIHVTVNDAEARSVTIDAIGYNTVAGQSIAAGQTSAVPEPATSAALLAAGAAGLTLYRRRKNLQRAA